VSVCRILMPLTLIAMAAFCVEASAQGAFPAPLPNQTQSTNGVPAASSPFPAVNGAAGAPAQRPASASPFPDPSSSNAAASQGVFSQGAAPVGGFGGGPPGGGGGDTAEQQACMEKFAPIRAEAEKRANAIKAASDRKAPPQEACGLIKSYVAAEAKLISYVTTKQTACNIPPEIPKQLKTSAARSHQMMKAVCQAAAQPQGGGAAPAPSLSEAIGGGGAGPEIRSVRSSRGSTFDTINGNVLAR
jgi:hypothetical protein